MAGYIGTQAVSVNTTSATISDDLAVGDDATITGNLDVDGTTNLDVTNIVGNLTVDSDTVTIQSANTTDPVLIIKNTTADGTSSRLHFVKDGGRNGANGDDLAEIDFIGDDAGQNQTTFGRIEALIASAADGSEGGQIRMRVATHDGEMQSGLIINDGSAEDEIDVTIGFGTASNTIISGKVLAANGGQGLPSHSFSGDTNTGMFLNSADTLGFSTGGTQRAFLSATQLNVTGNAIFAGTAHTFAGAATIGTNLTLTNGDLDVAAGHGINFAAQTATSASGASTVNELLNHYEDGSWTPVLTDNSGRAGTHSIQVARYIRVGRVVHIQGRVALSGLASMGGNMILTGLPFGSLNLSNCFASITIGQGAGLNITAGFSVCGNFSTNSTAMEIQLYDATTGSTAMTVPEFSADGDIIFSGTYIAN